MRLIRSYAALSIFLISSISLVGAQQPTVESLITQGKALEQTQKQGDAERAYLDAVRQAERQGSMSPKIPEALDALAEFYRQTAQFAKAEPRYERELQLLEKMLGSNHAQVADCLRRMGQCYIATNSNAEAERCLRRASQIYLDNAKHSGNYAHKNPSVERLAAAACLDELAHALRRNGNDGEANEVESQSTAIKANPTGR